MDIYEIRHGNLLALVEEAGSRQAFIRRTGKADAQVSQLLRRARNVGSTLARDLESAFNKPSGWMDIPHSSEAAGDAPYSGVAAWEDEGDLPSQHYVFIPRLEVKLSAGNGNVAWETAKKGAQAFRIEWLQEKGLSPDTLACMKATGDSMAPYIQDGDSLLIDLSDTELRDNDVYAIRYGDELRVKRLFKRFDHGIKIVSDNDDYPDDIVEHDELNNVAIIGYVAWRGG